MGCKHFSDDVYLRICHLPSPIVFVASGRARRRPPKRDRRCPVDPLVAHRRHANFSATAATAQAASERAMMTPTMLFPLALQNEGRPIIWLSPLFLFPDRQLGLT